MTIDELLENLMAYNDDELFYREYYYAKQDRKNFKSFLADLNIDELNERRLIVPEIKGGFMPSKLEDNAFFDEKGKNNIVVNKHNRYTPTFVHQHFFFELIYVLSGSCRQHINQETFTLGAGQFCLVAPNTEHSIGVFDSSIIINILIRHSTFEDIFYNILEDTNKISVFFNNSLYAKNQSPYLIADSENDSFIREQVLLMFMEYIEKSKYYENILNSSLMILFSKLLQKYEDNIFYSNETKKISSCFSDIMAYIYENYQHTSLNEIARHFHFSPEYCSRLIKQYTGKSFTKIQQNIRFSKACFFLENTNSTIAEISSLIGYHNVEHFNRLFKKIYGMTPSQYRKNC